ncbi:hypothetical protein ABIE88_008604 [Bradyrhizobium diazoefficiens]|uniref:helix-turn-helix domain-containing protein n=1 Tax=Bradyrhizobium diazoefficiens TaxID=1355477 RepID=UPI0035152382
MSAILDKDRTRRKLHLLTRANGDLRITDQDFRVLWYIADAIDHETDLARRKQATIAKDLGKKGVRGVQLSLGRLAEFGYLKFEVKEGGTYVNAYRLLSYAGFWVTRRSGGVVFRHLDDLDAVFESDTCDDLRQLICAFQPPPGL